MLFFFPCAHISQVSPKAAIDCALYVMHRWGHIKCFRFDNGLPFGDPNRKCFTPCALNLVARGCEVLFNPPRSPTRNAKVERNQGTTGRWADAKNSADFSAFYDNLNYAVNAQREKFPSRVCDNLTRLQYYPQLESNSRKYNPLDFDEQRIYKKLAKAKWFRKVASNGLINIFGKAFSIGMKNNGQMVRVQLIVENNEPFWQCYDEKLQPIAKKHAVNLADGSYYHLE